MKDNIKIGLLAVIAVTMIVDVFMEESGDNVAQDNSSAVSQPKTNKAVQQPNNMMNQQMNQNEMQQDNNKPAQPDLPPTSIKFAETEHDFGDIKQNTKNEKVFSFTNTGDKPLVIQNAKGSCGCTVPEYPKKPIAPGEKGEIKVVYSPGKQKNQQTKTVTITANTEPKTSILRIKANVDPGSGSESE